MYTPKVDCKQAALDPQRRVRRGRHALAVLTTLLALTAIIWVTRSLDNPAARVQAAWAARPFTAYRASIVRRYQIGDLRSTRRDCGMVVEVRPGAEPILLTGDRAEPRSLEAVLARFEPYASGHVASWTCELSDCTCAPGVVTVERDPRTGYLRRIARDWRAATVSTRPVWRLLAPAPRLRRATLLALAERWNPCPRGTGNHTSDTSHIYREELQIIGLKPLVGVSRQSGLFPALEDAAGERS